jgi:hypothetical protein
MANTQRLVENLDKAELDGSDLEALSSEKVKEPKTELPAKFQGKSVEDIINSYANLEKEFGRQGNELGELRKLSDKLISRTLEQSGPKVASEVKEEEITEEQYLNDPLNTIKKLVSEAVKPLQETVKSSTDSKRLQELEAKHPDARQLVQDEEFQSWVLESQARQKMWGKATEGDADFADELFSSYKREKQRPASTAPEDVGASEELTAATSISQGGSKDSALGSTKKTYSRAAIINLSLNDPRRYAALQDEIMKAYAEGRVV